MSERHPPNSITQCYLPPDSDLNDL